MTATAIRPTQTTSGIDLAAAQWAGADLLAALGHDLDDPQTRETPRRVASAYAELLTAPAFSPTSFSNDEGHDETVVSLRDAARSRQEFFRLIDISR